MLKSAIHLSLSDLHSFHAAVKSGDINAVGQLLDRNHALLNRTDAYGQNALMVIADTAQTDVACALLSRGADPHLAVSKIGSDWHGITPFQKALNAKQYALVNAFVHHTLTEENQGIAFDFITSADVAFEFMVLNPINASLIFHNPRLKTLLDQWNVHSKNHYHYYHTASDRRPSFYAEINDETGETIVFNKGEALGEGENGYVIDFISEANKHRALKYLKNKWVDFSSDIERDKIINRRKRESFFRNKAHPEEINALFCLQKVSPQKDCNLLSTVAIMPLIKGETLNTFFVNVSTLLGMTEIMLSILNALIQLHEKGMVHYDLNNQNVMVDPDTLSAKIIDFGSSYLLTEPEVIKSSYDPTAQWHMAPECFHCNNTEPLSPSITQDIYSLGAMFKQLIEFYGKSHESLADINELFPSISQFTMGALDKNPANRPMLSDFYLDLKAEQEAYQNRKSCTLS